MRAEYGITGFTRISLYEFLYLTYAILISAQIHTFLELVDGCWP